MVSRQHHASSVHPDGTTRRPCTPTAPHVVSRRLTPSRWQLSASGSIAYRFASASALIDHHAMHRLTLLLSDPSPPASLITLIKMLAALPRAHASTHVDSLCVSIDMDAGEGSSRGFSSHLADETSDRDQGLGRDLATTPDPTHIVTSSVLHVAPDGALMSAEPVASVSIAGKGSGRAILITLLGRDASP